MRILYVRLNGPEKKKSIFKKTLFKMNFFENAVFEITGRHLKKDDACENSCVGWGGGGGGGGTRPMGNANVANEQQIG